MYTYYFKMATFFQILLAIFSKINQTGIKKVQQTDMLISPQKCWQRVLYYVILSLAQIRRYDKHKDVHITLPKQRQAWVCTPLLGGVRQIAERGVRDDRSKVFAGSSQDTVLEADI